MRAATASARRRPSARAACAITTRKGEASAPLPPSATRLRSTTRADASPAHRAGRRNSPARGNERAVGLIVLLGGGRALRPRDCFAYVLRNKLFTTEHRFWRQPHRSFCVNIQFAATAAGGRLPWTSTINPLGSFSPKSTDRRGSSFRPANGVTNK